MSHIVMVHVTPRSGRDIVSGVKTIDGLPEIQARVTAPPDGGKANAAVCKMLAKGIGIAKGKVNVKRGDTSRHKQIEIDCSDDTFSAWMDSLESLD